MRVRALMRGESGVAMALTLMTLVVLWTISASLVAVVRNEYRSALLALDAQQALWLAEAGLERAIFELGRDADWTDARGATALQDPAGGWMPLCLDPGAEGGCGAAADALEFPAEEPLGRITVRWRSGGCGACVEVRAVGRVRGAARSVVALLRREAEGIRVVGWREEL
ncbi:MAG: hypothetical protein QN172_07710 [Armatimonadota bacterium]|nr:hypothetical protein [Armatimonadota bacterium]MDR7438968.1 hypothetical protein [Armatimonadota bacterium]MDR7562866.1 hypothetical protein [Armatimonadota bacterium]MDR7568537.1 hypothetical protein [Armatimonadota bacterium]MDR7602329.1 hypothetical protein [Armatimonadota bacterium]